MKLLNPNNQRHVDVNILLNCLFGAMRKVLPQVWKPLDRASFICCVLSEEKHSWEIKCSLFDRKRIQHFPLHVGTMLHKISLMWGGLPACTRSISPNSPSPRNHLLRLHFSLDWAPFYNIFNGALSVDKHIWGIGSVSVRFLPEGRENNALFLAKNKR